eukprot:c12608_g1_i1.p2 GENE.c12608_g1_i1~~c12608_g1_i1.p2  ORF type:complete len:205 (+),score=50.28 c12608_g1_i1:606-1220(+)
MIRRLNDYGFRKQRGDVVWTLPGFAAGTTNFAPFVRIKKQAAAAAAAAEAAAEAAEAGASCSTVLAGVKRARSSESDDESEELGLSIRVLRRGRDEIASEYGVKRRRLLSLETEQQQMRAELNSLAAATSLLHAQLEGALQLLQAVRADCGEASAVAASAAATAASAVEVAACAAAAVASEPKAPLSARAFESDFFGEDALWLA